MKLKVLLSVLEVSRTHTHHDSFDEDVVHFVLGARKVGNRNLFVGSDARPCRNGLFHLLDLCFLVFVAILQSGTRRSDTASSALWLFPSGAIFHCDRYHPYLYQILTLVGKHSSVLHTVQLRSPCICHFVCLSDRKDKMKFQNICLNEHHCN